MKFKPSGKLIYGMLELLISWKTFQLASKDIQMYASAVDRYTFLKDFCTIKLSMGRRSGHSYGTIQFVQELDKDEYVVIVPNHAIIRPTYEHCNYYVIRPEGYKGEPNNYKYIFVDPAEMFSEKMDIVYKEIMALTTEPFPIIVLIG